MTGVAPTTPRTAGPPRGSARGPELLHPDGRAVATAATLGVELLERVRPAARTLGSEPLVERIDPRTCEADRQVAFATPHEAAADLVVRSLD